FKERMRTPRLDEVVCCARDLTSARIITLLEQLRNTGVTFKIAQPAAEFIIGPSTTESLQDLLVLREHAVDSPPAKRRRRTMDLLLALGFPVTPPGGMWGVAGQSGYVRNQLRGLRGTPTWVAYS